MFNYSHVIVRGLPRTFTECLTLEKPSSPIDVSLAMQQKERYEQALKNVVPNFVKIDADDGFPDCVFIEDPYVIIEKLAVMNNMKATTRNGEGKGIRQKLLDLGVKIVDMNSPAFLDGGDVLVCKEEILVGISRRTNEDGAKFLQSVFARHVRTIPGNLYDTQIVYLLREVEEGLHFKSVLSLLDEETIVVADTHQGHQMAQLINQGKQYKFVFVPDTIAANVLRVRNTVFIQDGFPNSQKILETEIAKRGLQVTALQMSELIKADGALTCCSLFLS